MKPRLSKLDVPAQGMAAWAAYGTVEVLFAIAIRRSMFASTFVPPDDRYTLLLLVFYPLVGALLGRFAVYGLAITFLANAFFVMSWTALAAPVLSAAIAVAMYRKNPWVVSLLLLSPIWAAREIGLSYTFRTKALLAGAAIIAVMLFGLLVRRVRWSLKPLGRSRSSR